MLASDCILEQYALEGLFEVLASLLRAGQPFRVTAAEMRFDRYVELGVPFTVEQTEGDDETAVDMAIRQSGRVCTQISYRISPEDPQTGKRQI